MMWEIIMGVFQQLLNLRVRFKLVISRRYFFGTDVLKFTGSRVPDRSPEDILADYFGLPTDYKSTVLVTPCAENALLISIGIAVLIAGIAGYIFVSMRHWSIPYGALHLEEYQNFLA